MSVLDIILVVILICSAVTGGRQGLVRQACGIVGIILGIILTQRFSSSLSSWLDIARDWSQIVCFIVILIVVILVFALVGWLFRKVFKLTGFGLWDRIGGIVLALAKDALILGVLLGLWANFNTLHHHRQSKLIENSALYQPLRDYSSTVFGYILEPRDK